MSSGYRRACRKPDPLLVDVVTPPGVGQIGRMVEFVVATVGARLRQHLLQRYPAMLESHGAARQIHAIGAQRTLALLTRQRLACFGHARPSLIAPGPTQDRNSVRV